MYSKTANNVTVFVNDKQKELSTEKCKRCTISESVKDEYAENGWRYDSWDARFIGKAVEKFVSLGLVDKTRITITEWNTVNQYVKADEGKEESKGHRYTYVLVYDFELRAENENQSK